MSSFIIKVQFGFLYCRRFFGAPSPEPFEESVWSLSHLINRDVTAAAAAGKRTWTMNANPDAVMTRNGLLKSLPRNGRTIEKVDW